MKGRTQVVSLRGVNRAGEVLTRVADGSTGCLAYFLTVTWSPRTRHRRCMEGNASVELDRSSLAHMKSGAILVNPEKPLQGILKQFSLHKRWYLSVSIVRAEAVPLSSLNPDTYHSV